ncbi:MAG: GGDEF domain-containing protein [Oscillospiraceae bacterium]|nr:GGDEF domain-containing protein [Oscillospiraceae bacterium]
MKASAYPDIAVIVAGTNEEFQSSVLSGMAEAAVIAQANLTCFASFSGVLANHRCDIGEDNIYNLPDFTRFDGAVLLTNTLEDAVTRANIIQQVKAAGIPTVVLDDNSTPEFCNIRIDNSAAMREIVQHVITEHHARSFYYVSGPLSNPEANTRYLAFLETAEQNGIAVRNDQIYFGHFRPIDGKNAAEALLRSGKPLPDAIIAANDAMALEAISVLRQHGIRVPEDIIVTGFDHTYYAKHHSPSLTTVNRPLSAAGRLAVETVLQMIRGETVSHTLTLSADPVYQESCGCLTSDKIDIQAYKQNTYELIKQTRADASLLNRMTAALAVSETQSDAVDMFSTYLQEISCESCCICLCENWQHAFHETGSCSEDLILPIKGYTENMCAVLILHADGTIGSASFSSADLDPEPPENGGNIRFFLPLHFRECCIGYYIIKNGDFPIQSILCHSILMSISHSFENIRKLLHLNNAIREMDRLYVSDALCGIYNRNGFIRLADRFFRECQQRRQQLMIGFIDMDGLKYVNDHFGHEEGDFSLRTLASVISECCGDHFTCARFGGDEFILIGQNADEEDAEQFEKRFTEKLAETNAAINKPYPLAASIGTYVTTVTEDMKLFELIKRADQIMYEQKKRKSTSRYLRRD